MERIVMSNALAVLSAYNKPAVSALMKDYPENEDLLTGKKKYGSELATMNFLVESKEKPPQNKKGIAEFNIETLDQIQKRLEPNLSRLRRQLASAKKMRFVAYIISALTSVGLVAAILNDAKKTLSIVTAGINLVSTCIIGWAGYLETPSIGGSKDLVSFFADFNKMMADAGDVEQKFKSMIKSNDYSEMKAFAKKTEDICSELRKIEGVLWGKSEGGESK